MKTALITGTSTGIGLSTAILLAKAGYAVTATMRNPDKAGALRERAKAEGIELEVAQLDVQDSASVQAAVNAMIAKHGQIDLLVNNAGSGYLGTLEQTPIEDAQMVMDVNFFGVWRTTQAVLPHMRQAGSGRIVNVSSVGGLIGQPFNEAYCAAKFALEGAMEALAPTLKVLGIRAVMVEPGFVSTEFVANVGGLMKRQPDPADPYLPLMQNYIAYVRKNATLGQTPDEVAVVIVEAATAPDPHFRYLSSDGVRQRAGIKYSDTTGDAVIAAMSKVLEG